MTVAQVSDVARFVDAVRASHTGRAWIVAAGARGVETSGCIDVKEHAHLGIGVPRTPYLPLAHERLHDRVVIL